MARPKGQPKLGGRQKGTPNKTTTAIKDMIVSALDNLGEKIQDEIARKLFALSAEVNPGTGQTTEAEKEKLEREH